MKILTTTTGIYPKITSASDCPNLRASLHKFDREKITAAELEEIVQANIRRAVTEQLAADIDLPTDGLIRWTDLFSPFVSAWDGLTRRGIHRFYDTNTLYGEPVVESDIQYQPSLTAKDFQFAQTVNEGTKTVLPGSFTFAEACVDNFYNNPAKLRTAISTGLLAEARQLIEAGAKYIEVHEPQLGWAKHDPTEITEAYKQFGELPATVIVISYFRNFDTATVQALIDAGVGIGIDTTTPHERPPTFEGVIFQLGVVDSRNTLLESTEQLREKKEKIEGIFAGAKEILFSTTSHVEYLPHAKALSKINLLKNLR